MPEGKIKKLISDRGFGFIEGDRGELFFHHSEVNGVTFEELSEGQMVEYEIGQGRKGPCATSVREELKQGYWDLVQRLYTPGASNLARRIWVLYFTRNKSARPAWASAVPCSFSFDLGEAVLLMTATLSITEKLPGSQLSTATDSLAPEVH